MKNTNYIRFKEKTVYSKLLGIVTWVSLTTFMLVAKNEIGIRNIPIFETLIFITSLISTRYIYSMTVSIKTVVGINVLLETVFLMCLYYILLTSDDLAVAGVAVYGIIIFNAFTNPMENETMRHFEDKKLKHSLYKKHFRKLRKQYHLVGTIGAVIGSSIGLLFLTYFKVDLIEFTLVMLILNILTNGYDYYLWHKYLK